MIPTLLRVIRDYQATDEPAVLDLLNADRLPGQPAVTSRMLADALVGRASIDEAYWQELSGIRTRVAASARGEIVGAVSSALRPRDDTAVILWLHAREERDVLAELLVDEVERHRDRDRITAFEFATPLTAGLEALPVRHRPATRRLLLDLGFTETDLWRYMAIDPRGRRVPPRPVGHFGWAFSPTADHGMKMVLEKDGAAVGEIEIGMPADGIGAIWWVETAAGFRGAGLGRYLAETALSKLAGRGANCVILYVDDDEPDPLEGRDRRAASRMYDAIGFAEIDRLCSYQRLCTAPAVRGVDERRRQFRRRCR